MPTDTFSITTDAADGDAYRSKATYPLTSGYSFTVSDDGVGWAERSLDTDATYYISNTFLRFDTSAIPDDATITEASLKVHVLTIVVTESLNYTGGWYDFGGEPSVDGDMTVANDNGAFSVTSASLTVDTVNTIALTSPAANINKSGYTGLRLSMAQRASDAAPTSVNHIQIAMNEHATAPAAQLTVTWTVPGEVTVVNGNRGTATEKTSDQTLALTPSGTLAAGNYALLAVVVDNPGTDEGATNYISVTDTGPGATWTKLREQTEANTAALTGVTCALFLAKLTADLTAAHSVAIALTANATAKGAGLAELTTTSGYTIGLSAGGANGSNGGASSYSVALSSLTNVIGMYIGMAAAEDETDAFVTLDTAYSALAFGSIGSGTASTSTTNVRARVGTLSNISTGDTFDSSVSSADRATILVRIEGSLPAADETFSYVGGSYYPN